MVYSICQSIEHHIKVTVETLHKLNIYVTNRISSLQHNIIIISLQKKYNENFVIISQKINIMHNNLKLFPKKKFKKYPIIQEANKLDKGNFSSLVYTVTHKASITIAPSGS